MTAATHTLVRVEAITGDELARVKAYPENRSAFYGRNRGAGIGRVVPGSALVVPPPPDYSTPAAVSARCWEAGTRATDDLRAAGKDTTFRRAYRELRKAVPALPCRVEDRHVSRWRIVRNTDGAWTLAPVEQSTEQPARPRRRRAAAA